MKHFILFFFFATCIYSAGAQQQALSADEVVINPLSINTEENDIAPVFLHNGKLLYFTSERDASGLSAAQKIFVVPRTASGWGEPQALPEEVNAGEHNGAATLTPDGQFMVFSAYDHSVPSIGRTDLYSARKVNGRWTDIQNLGADVNSPYWDSQPFLSSDGTTLYFASDRPGGSGGVDIYRSKRTDRGWSAAANMGARINSSSDEMTPSVAADNERLYFSSNRSGGFGGFDIYTAEAVANSSATSVVNIGTPVNSPADEYFYVSVANARQAYFTSGRDAKNLNLYTAIPDPAPGKPVLMVRGMVTDAVNKNPLGSHITVTDLKTGKTVANLHNDDVTGEYFVVLTPGREYSLTSSKPGYLFYSERFEVPTSERGRDVVYNIALSPIANGSVRLLIFFDFDEDELQPPSYGELARVADFLTNNSDVSIRLEGHADDQGVEEYNKALSKRRAEAVKLYLVKHGIASSRIAVEGFGQSRPLVQGTSEDARAKNRRVEMRIEP